MMELKNKRLMIAVALVFLLGTSLTVPVCFAAEFDLFRKKTNQQFAVSAVFPIKGNVYPLGYYSVSLNIGSPPKLFELDIDSGSDLTWVQCDAPCTGCTKPRDQLYKPHNNAMHCAEPLCSAFHLPTHNPCKKDDDQCDYEIEYADHGSSLGVLVNDSLHLKLTNGTSFSPRVGFGCGYDQKYSGSHAPPSTAGVLGLGNGKVSILSQLRSVGLIRNVVGHCLSREGGGFVFFGDDLIPSSGMAWTQMSKTSMANQYSAGPAEVYFDGKSVGIKGLTFIFDSGSSYTYFNSQVYKTILDLVKNNLQGKPLKNAPEDKSLPICWKGSKPFKTALDVKQYFKPLALRFTATKNVQILIPPEAYLIVTNYGNVCFSILNGAEVGLGNLNVLGDISLLDKMVIYDNENQRIGWVAANCNRLPNEDGDCSEGLFQPYAAILDILHQHCPTSYFSRDQ